MIPSIKKFMWWFPSIFQLCFGKMYKNNAASLQKGSCFVFQGREDQLQMLYFSRAASLSNQKSAIAQSSQ